MNDKASVFVQGCIFFWIFELFSTQTFLSMNILPKNFLIQKTAQTPHIIPFIAILSNNISKFHLVPRAAHKTRLDQLDKVWVLKQHWGMTVIQSSQWCVILAFLLKYPVLAYMLHMGWENQSCSNYQIVYKFSWIDHNTGLSTGIL